MMKKLSSKNYKKRITTRDNGNQEKRVDNILKKPAASNSISEETRRSLKPLGIRPAGLYPSTFADLGFS